MNQGFPHYWAGCPGRGRGRWFHPNYMPNEEFWRNRPASWWDCHPEQQRVYYSNNCNFRGYGRSRGYFHEKRPYRGRTYRGSKSSFSKGSFQKTSLSSLMPSKKENNSEKVEDQRRASKETKQEKDESAPSVNEPEPPKVSQEASCAIISPQQFSFCLPTDSLADSESKEEVLPRKKEKNEVQVKESQASEDLPNQTTSARTPIKKQTLSGTIEGLPTMEKEEPVLVPESKQDMNLSSLTDSSRAVEPLVPPETKETIPSLESVKTKPVKVEVRQATENPPSQIAPVPSPGEPTQEQTPSETTEGLLHPIEQGNSVLLEASHSSCVSIPLAVEIPFLSKTPEDHQCEEKKEIDLEPAGWTMKHLPRMVFLQKASTASSWMIPPFLLETGAPGKRLTQILGNCEDVDWRQACVAPAINASSLSSTFSEIHCVPVLVRQSKIELPYSWESASFHDENLIGWAPEDCQEPPWSVSQASKCDKVFDYDRDLVSCQSPPHTLVSCTPKCDTGRLLEHHSCSPKSHHSSDSKHSSSNWAPRELCIQSLRSPHRWESSSRPTHRQKPSSRSSHRHCSRSPCRRQHHSQSSFKREHSPQRQEQRSRSPSRRREDSGRSYCHCKHGCNLPQEYSWETERSKAYEVPYSCSLESPIVARKTNLQKTKKKISVQLKRTEKKRTTSEKVTKSTKIKKKARSSLCAVEGTVPSEIAQNLQPLRTEDSEQMQTAASREDVGSPHHPSAGKKNSFSPLSWTPEDRSAAVLARKEEIEQVWRVWKRHSKPNVAKLNSLVFTKYSLLSAYLQVLLNFAAVATMLVEKEPCMEKAMESALRANLRKIGDYYECLLKNYIDSLAETS